MGFRWVVSPDYPDGQLVELTAEEEEQLLEDQAALQAATAAWKEIEFDVDDPADEARAVLEAIGFDQATADEHEVAYALLLVDGIHWARRMLEDGRAEHDARDHQQEEA